MLATSWVLAAACSLFALALLFPSAGSAHSLYVTNSTARTVSAFTIGANGTPIPVAGSPFSVGITPVGVAASPDAEHLYVANLESNNVSAFTIASNGHLSPVPGSPFATGAGPWGVAVSPDGAYLYVADSNANRVSAYSIASDGSLSPVPGSPFSTGSAPGGMKSNGVAVTPDGEHLYVTNMNGGSVSAYTIASDGSLSPVLGSPFEAGDTARPVSVSPDGKHLYVGTVEENIWAYSIGSDGALSQIAGSPFLTGGQALGLAMAPDGAHLYETHVGGGDNVWGYSIAGDGVLTPVSGSPFPTGGFRGNSATVSPDGKHLYATNSGSNDLSVFAIGANGGLSAIGGSPFSAGTSALQVAMTPDQGPVAAFSATPTPAGNPLSFDASASSDSDGSVARYHWDFGDGQSKVTSTATTTHVYDSPGEYTVTLTATDDEGCSTAQTFTGQTVSCNGSSLAQVSHQIIVPPGEPLNLSLSGSGSVTSSPSGIGCPGVCSYAFEPGTQVTLTPEPASGSVFVGWSEGGCAGTAECQVTVDNDTEVTATFREIPPPEAPPPPTPTLRVQVGGRASGSVSAADGGISCPSACSHSYPAGAHVTLIATPAAGARFAGWSGSGCADTADCQLSVGADMTVTATFEEVPAVNPGLRIGPVRGTASSSCRSALRVLARLLRSNCGKAKIMVQGGITKVARGAVRVRADASLHGRRIHIGGWARILDGHWRVHLPFPWEGSSKGTVVLTARFGGSSGVQSGFAKRRVRVVAPT